MRNKPFILGVTGPTGSGKSEFAAMLREADVPVIDADALAREVTVPGHPCLAELAAAFSPDVLRADGSLDRAALAKLAFASPQATERLNAVTHPHILKLADERVTACFAAGADIVAVDAPLLFESGMDAICDRTLAVLAPAADRLARILLRDGITKEGAAARMNAQPDEAYYVSRADDVLWNRGDLGAFYKAARVWIARLKVEVYGG